MVSEALIKMVIVAVGMICFDVVTGIVSAFATGTFKSSIMRKGGWHKLSLLIAVAFGVFLEVAQGMIDIGVNIPCGSGIAGYIILMEICSCVENINKACPGAVPSTIIKAFNTALEVKSGEEKKDD